ncbi:MAG: zf-HC2 domain-containing protein [Planctomycetota bacterium]
MTGLRCERARQQLPEFVAGDLEAARAELLRGHLRGCHECRRSAGEQLQAARALRRAVCATIVPGVDDALFLDLHERVLNRVAGEEPPRPRGAGGLMRGGRAAAVVAASVLIACGWMLARPGAGAGLIDRSPIRGGGGAAAAVPVRGPAMQWLSHESVSTADPAVGGSGQGLMGRLSLRTLEDEHLILLPLDAEAPLLGRDGAADGAADGVGDPAGAATGSDAADRDR